MNSSLVFLPVVVQILLTICLIIRLAALRAKAAQQGLVDESRRALHGDAWPDNVMQVNNSIRNQFETPVLFYVVIILLWLTNGVNIYVHILAWTFVILRVVHALVHIRSNYVPLRRKVFILGGLNLIALTLLLVYSILMGA